VTETFVVSLAHLPTPDDPESWQGRVVHVRTGRRLAFRGLGQLLEFLRSTGEQEHEEPPT
jgi:hypothetical protein